MGTVTASRTEGMSVALRVESLRGRGPLWGRPIVLVPAAAGAAWLAGRSVVQGGQRLALVLTVAAVVLFGTIARAVTASRLRYGALALEIPLILLLASTLGFRERTADSLAYNPLDPAAQFRVACVAAAGILGLIAFISRPHSSSPALSRLTTLPFRIFMLYVAVVFLGAPGSINPTLTAYRGVEFAAAIFVFLGARRVLGGDAVPRIESTLFWYFAALMISVWVGVVLFPSEAIEHTLNLSTPIPWNITGVYPKLSANSAGTVGVVLAVWSVARVHRPDGTGKLKPFVGYSLAAAGAATTIFAQYRTGYGALIVAGLVFLLVRRTWVLLTVASAAVAAVLVMSPSLVTTAEPYVLRGQTRVEATALSGRVEFWRNAIPVWKRSPLIGRGLVTASRFEVLAPLGFDRTSSIHGTWVELLVGTGVVGLAVFALAVMCAIYRASVEAYRWRRATAIVLLTAFMVRSATGSTFELFDINALVFLFVALSLEDRANVRAADAPRDM